MAKPTFLLFFGYGWAAGSPLCYTLQRLSKYCHLGFYKSASYIHSICNDPSSLVDGNLYKKIRKEQFSSLEDLTDYGRQAGHKLHLPVDRQPLKDFPIDLLLDMVYTPPSVEKYINYYKTLWNCVKPHGYKAVATFEELNPFSPNLSDFLQQLSQHFNLKGITILRDPIRRALSHYGSLMDAYQDEPIPKEFVPDVKNYLDNWLAQKQLVPDSQFFIMETLWDQGPKGDKERQKLSDFLDTPITDLWPNLYVPDKGHYLTWDLDKHFCPTPCQPPGQSLRARRVGRQGHHRGLRRGTGGRWSVGEPGHVAQADPEAPRHGCRVRRAQVVPRDVQGQGARRARQGLRHQVARRRDRRAQRRL